MNRSRRLTGSHVQRVHREVADAGPLPGFEHFTEEQYDAHLSRFMEERPDGPILVFCYGSLIWKPCFAAASTRRATAHGWHRSFCLRVARFRGTLDSPGLMMQIDRGGSCDGVVQEVPRESELPILRDLWRREMTVIPPSNLPRWIEVDCDGKLYRAIAFTANQDSPNYEPGLAIGDVAKRLVDGCGHWGSGVDYLHQTITALENAGIHDPYLWELEDNVALVIEARYPDAWLE